MIVYHTIIRDGEVVELECDVDITPASRGHRDSFGCPESPDEPSEAEIRSITPGEIELDADETAAVEGKALEAAEDERYEDM